MPRAAAIEVAERVFGAAAERWQDQAAARRALAREAAVTGCAECLRRVIGAAGPVLTSAAQRGGVHPAAWAQHVGRKYR